MEHRPEMNTRKIIVLATVVALSLLLVYSPAMDFDNNGNAVWCADYPEI
jgi:hypothetical protein